MSKSTEWYRSKVAEDPSYLKKRHAQLKERLNEDPAYYARRKVSKQKSAALNERSLAWNIPKSTAEKLIIETKKCQLSGRDLVLEVGHIDSPSLDRINNAYGYSLKNVQVTSQFINKARGTMTVDEFVQMCVDVAQHHGFSSKMRR
jgi:hypothetical protein